MPATTSLAELVACACPVAGVGEGVTVAVVRLTVELLFPNPKNVHHRNKMATRPRTAANSTFFFSPGLPRSINSITCLPALLRRRTRGSLEISCHIQLQTHQG